VDFCCRERKLIVELDAAGTRRTSTTTRSASRFSGRWAIACCGSGTTTCS